MQNGGEDIGRGNRKDVDQKWWRGMLGYFGEKNVLKGGEGEEGKNEAGVHEGLTLRSVN